MRILALLPSWLPASDFSFELQDGHLLRWQGQWSPIDSFEARVWGRDGGWVSGSLRAEPFIMGPLRGGWSESAPWVWAPDPLARQGTWGGVFQLPWGAAWLTQDPDGTRSGAEALVKFEAFGSGLGYERSWPEESDRLRGLIFWKTDLCELRVRGQQLSSATELTVLTGRTDFRLHPDEFDLGMGLESLETGKILCRVSASAWGIAFKAEMPWEDPQDAVGEVSWSFKGSEGGLRTAVVRSTRGWSNQFQLSLERVGWSLGFSGAVPWSGDLWEASMLGTLRSESGNWSGRANWKMATSGQVGATLSLGWSQLKGPWKAEFKMEAPQLVAQWFGPENHTTLVVSTSLRDQSPQ